MKVTLNLKRVSKFQDFFSKSFLSMYCILYFNIKLLYALGNDISSNSDADFQIPFAATSGTTVSIKKAAGANLKGYLL